MEEDVDDVESEGGDGVGGLQLSGELYHELRVLAGEGALQGLVTAVL